MIACTKCGATNDGNIAGLNPCHLRTVVEDHNFLSSLSTGFLAVKPPGICFEIFSSLFLCVRLLVVHLMSCFISISYLVH